MSALDPIYQVAVVLVAIAALRIGARYLGWRSARRMRRLPLPGQWWELYAQGPVVVVELCSVNATVRYELIEAPLDFPERMIVSEGDAIFGPGARRRDPTPNAVMGPCPVSVFLDHAVQLPGPPTRRELMALHAGRMAQVALQAPGIAQRPTLVAVEEEGELLCGASL